MDYPCKANYDFLRRHYPNQVKGSKFDYFLSACSYKLPCIYFVQYYTPTFLKIQWVLPEQIIIICSGKWYTLELRIYDTAQDGQHICVSQSEFCCISLVEDIQLELMSVSIGGPHNNQGVAQQAFAAEAFPS